MPARLDVAALPGGWENLNLRVQADGERFVLRGYVVTDPAEVRWELKLLRFLNGQTFPTPTLILREDGDALSSFGGRPAALFAFVEGHHPVWGAPEAAEVAARIVAELHRVTAGLSLPYPRTRLDNRKRLARFRTFIEARGVGPEETALRQLTEDVARYVAGFAARLRAVEAATSALPQGVVHHDAHANNLLFDDTGQLVALLDFDDAHETFLLADLAMMLDVWGVEHTTSQFEPDRARRVLDVYRQHRPLTASERILLPDVMALFNLADATQYVRWRMASGTPADAAVLDCDQYRRCRQHTASQAWRDQLRDALL